MFSVMSCDSTMSSFGLDGLAISTYQYTGHQTKRAIAYETKIVSGEIMIYPKKINNA